MEYFIVANSFAAPFFSDTDKSFQEASNPEEALLKFKDGYRHPAGLYGAGVWADANAYHKNEKPLARWVCNLALAKEEAAKGKGSYSMLGVSQSEFEIDGVRHKVENPRCGKVVLAS